MQKCELSIIPGADRLQIALSGRIDSTNAEDFEHELISARNKRPGGEIALDCKDLEYISSAGLRVLLKLEKKEKDSLRLINVSQEVDEILDMTGFSEILNVSRAMRDISGEAGEFMGESGGIGVYRMPDDAIMKLYPAGTPYETVTREREYAKVAFVCGVPTLIAYDIVTYKGCYAMLYEFMKSNTASALIDLAPMKLPQIATEMGELLRTIHACVPASGALPRASALFDGWAEGMRKRLSSQEVGTLRRLVRAIPEADTLVYGNFHARNVFIRKHEAMVINMSGISCGNPLYDLGMAYTIHVSEAELLSKPLSGLSAAQAKNLWRHLLPAYLGTNDAEKLKEAEKLIRAAALLCSALLPAALPLPVGSVEQLVAHARRDLIPAADTLADLYRTAKIEIAAEAEE